MSNFDINVDRQTNGWMDRQADAYVTKSAGQGDVSCKVWWLFSLVVEYNTNFDINVKLRYKCWQTDGWMDWRTDGKADNYVAPCYKQVRQKW